MHIKLSTYRLETDREISKTTQNQAKKSKSQVPGTANDANNSQLVSKQVPKPTKKVSQEQHIVPVSPDKVQIEVVNTLVNPELKTLFDIESNKEMQVTSREPDMTLLNPEAPLIKPSEKITIF